MPASIQPLLHERMRLGGIHEYIWPSGIGPCVEEPAPLEEVRLEKR